MLFIQFFYNSGRSYSCLPCFESKAIMLQKDMIQYLHTSDIFHISPLNTISENMELPEFHAIIKQ